MTQILLALVLAFDAGSNAPPPPHHGHHAPPKEAIDACTNKKADDTCSFTMHDHNISGTCKAPPDNASQLACRPDHPPPHHGGSGDGPPPPK